MLEQITSRLKFIEIAALAAMVSVLVYIVFALKSGNPVEFHWADDKILPQPVSGGNIQDGLKLPRPFDFYSSQINQRDVFSTAALNAPPPASTQTAAAASGPALPLNYKIVGIVLGDPSEVVIEDTNLKQTLFFVEGETRGDIKIEHISQGGVAINYQGQTQQLKIKE